MKKCIKGLASILAGMMLLSGCGGGGSENGDKIETVTWYIPTLITGNGKQAVMDQVNQLLEEKYKMRLDLIGIDGGNYDQKMQVMNAGQEEYDLAFTSHWTNHFYSNVANGAFYEITEEDLKTYAPKTYASMSEEIWNAAKVNGKIYAVPNWQIQTRATGINAPAEMLEKVGMTIDQLNSMENITTYLEKITAQDPECNKLEQMWTQLMPYNEMLEVYEEEMPGAIYFTKQGKPEVFNQYETQEFTDYVHMRQEWVERGLSVDSYLPDSKAGDKEIKQCPLSVHVYKPGSAEEVSQSAGYRWETTQFSQAVLSSSGVTAALTGISATSKNPQAALKMIEIINTDAEIHNLLSYGIEGQDYEKTSENQIRIKEEKEYSGIANWLTGTVANTYLLETQSPTTWEETKKFNDEAILSPILGFNADLNNITVQVSNCKTVIKEYLEMLDLGLSDDAKLAEFREKLKTAGVDDIINELQQQIDGWYAAQEGV